MAPEVGAVRSGGIAFGKALFFARSPLLSAARAVTSVNAKHFSIFMMWSSTFSGDFPERCARRSTVLLQGIISRGQFSVNYGLDCSVSDPILAAAASVRSAPQVASIGPRDSI